MTPTDHYAEAFALWLLQNDISPPSEPPKLPPHAWLPQWCVKCDTRWYGPSPCFVCGEPVEANS